jgi:hypothetical protein
VIGGYGTSECTFNFRQLSDSYAVLRQQYAAIQALTLL